MHAERWVDVSVKKSANCKREHNEDDSVHDIKGRGDQNRVFLVCCDYPIAPGHFGLKVFFRFKTLLIALCHRWILLLTNCGVYFGCA